MLRICSLFCFDLSTHPDCPLHIKADHILLFYPLGEVKLGNVHYKKTNISQCGVKVAALKAIKVWAGA